eukprot:CAMPEP_0169430606 /NCGR_PEP_ID=MMETSP1042-20121227/2492_1 /TAXON_ID=464988 /ORGANISM="Hemiselmis andersenii, Strain CCMP1180" /LENGTH=424 /DNA_ID=CAMNT_0009540939 /DNA_START=126 /DNA_END=1401 /DNA_ORIENTATION=-
MTREVLDDGADELERQVRHHLVSPARAARSLSSFRFHALPERRQLLLHGRDDARVICKVARAHVGVCVEAAAHAPIGSTPACKVRVQVPIEQLLLVLKMTPNGAQRRVKSAGGALGGELLERRRALVVLAVELGVEHRRHAHGTDLGHCSLPFLAIGAALLLLLLVEGGAASRESYRARLLYSRKLRRGELDGGQHAQLVRRNPHHGAAANAPQEEDCTLAILLRNIEGDPSLPTKARVAHAVEGDALPGADSRGRQPREERVEQRLDVHKGHAAHLQEGGGGLGDNALVRVKHDEAAAPELPPARHVVLRLAVAHHAVLQLELRDKLRGQSRAGTSDAEKVDLSPSILCAGSPRVECLGTGPAPSSRGEQMDNHGHRRQPSEGDGPGEMPWGEQLDPVQRQPRHHHRNKDEEAHLFTFKLERY